MRHDHSLGIGLLCSIIYSFFIDSFYPSSTVYLSLVSFSFVVSVAIRFINHKNFEDLVFLPIIALTWIYFLNPFLKPEEVTYINRTIPEVFYFELAFFPSMGIIAMYLGYYSFFKNSNYLFNPKFQLSNENIKGIIYIFGILGLTYNILSFIIPSFLAFLSNTIQVLSYANILSVCFYLFFKLRGGNDPKLSVFAIIVLSAELLGIISTTLFAYLIRFFVALIFVYIYERRTIPYKVVIIGLILLFPLFSLRNEYRNKFQNDSFISKLSNGSTILVDSYSKFSFYTDLSQDKVEEKTSQRLENLSYLGQCVYMHEYRGKEFRFGSTFWWLPLAPIPRAIFPWKPENIMATKVAYEYRLKMIDDRNSAFNFPMLAEAYINFGFWGIIIWSFMQGILFKFFLSKIAFGKGDMNFIVLLNLLPWLTHMEGNITLVFGGILQVYVFWWFLRNTNILNRIGIYTVHS